MSSDAERVLADVARTLDVLGVRWYLSIVLGAPGIEEYFLTRSEELLVGATRVPTPLGEDLVVMKLLAGRENDLEDAKALVKAGASLAEVAAMVEAIAEGLGEDDILGSLAELRRRVAR